MSLPSASRGDQTRTAILQAAHDLFIRQGYHGTSMRQIAADAQLALGGLYNHFASKEQVFEAVLLAFHPYHEVFPLLEAARGANLEELVSDAMRRIAQVIPAHPEFLNLMFIELVEFKNAHLETLFAIIYPQGMSTLLRLVSSHPDQLRPIPPPMLVRTFLGLFFGYFLTEAVLTPGTPPELRENALHYFTDIYLHGVISNTPLLQLHPENNPLHVQE